jgi:thioredoxin reductase
MTDPAELSTDILIIGGGPAGLTAAAALAPRVDGEVLVVEREATAGGIPRHSAHPGYGIRDLRTFLPGPAYARRVTRTALAAGARIRTQAMVTGWAGPRTVDVTSPDGRQRITARGIILATGARERPRPARLVPGDRSAGIYTTGQLQNLVHLHHRTPGNRAVIVGAELVSWSAAITLRQARCRPVLMTTAHARPESYAAFTLPGRVALRMPVATRTRIVRIIGTPRVEAVELEDLDTRARTTVACDTVVFTGDWIPDSELARAADLDMDPHTRGPLVDTAQATSRKGVFAIGNLTHPVDTADVAALDGRAVAEHVLRFLAGGATVDPAAQLRVLPGHNLLWISPGRVDSATAPPRRRILSWPRELIRTPTVTVRQGDVVLAARRVPWPASPGRVFRIPSSLISAAKADHGPLRVDVT